MMQALILGLLLLVQVPEARPTSKFQWTNTANSLGEVSGWKFQIELDNLTQSRYLVHTCNGTISPYVCEAPIPTMTTTTHSARIRAVNTNKTPVEYSDWSDRLTFRMLPAGGIIITKPTKPGNLTIIPGL